MKLNNVKTTYLKCTLNNIDNLKMFVDYASRCSGYASRCSGDVIVKNEDRVFEVDGSSIMGMLSLDLSKPVYVYTNHIVDLEYLYAKAKLLPLNIVEARDMKE